MQRNRVSSGQGILLKHWHRQLVYLVCLLVSLTGVLWFFSHDLLHADPNDFQRWMLTLHGAASFLATMIFGSLLTNHVRIGWAMKRNLVSGLLVFAMFCMLIITAFLLYYGSEDYRSYERWLHIGLGILGFVVLPLHVLLGRRSRVKLHHF